MGVFNADLSPLNKVYDLSQEYFIPHFYITVESSEEDVVVSQNGGFRNESICHSWNATKELLIFFTCPCVEAGERQVIYPQSARPGSGSSISGFPLPDRLLLSLIELGQLCLPPGYYSRFFLSHNEAIINQPI